MQRDNEPPLLTRRIEIAGHLQLAALKIRFEILIAILNAAAAANSPKESTDTGHSDIAFL